MAIETTAPGSGAGGTTDDDGDSDGGGGGGSSSDDTQTQQETDPSTLYQDPGATSGGTTTETTSPSGVSTGDTQEETEATGGSVEQTGTGDIDVGGGTETDPTGIYQQTDAVSGGTTREQTSPSTGGFEQAETREAEAQEEFTQPEREAFTRLQYLTESRVRPDDVVRAEGGLQLGREARQRELRTRAARASPFGYTDLRVQGARAPGADAEQVRETGPEVSLDTQAFRERYEAGVAAAVEEESGRTELADVPAGTRRVTGIGPQTATAEQARDFADIERGRDFTVETEAGETQIRFTEDFFERELTEELDIAAEAGEDFTIQETDDGQQVTLTAEGRQDAISSELLDRGEIEVDEPAATIPSGLTFGAEVTIGGDTRTIDIESADQLEFDEEGNLVNVRQPETSEAEVQAAQERLASAVPVVGDQFAEFAFETRAALQGLGDVATDAGSAFQEQVEEPVSEFAADVGSAAGEAVTATALATPEARLGFEEDARQEAQAEAVEGAQEQFQDVFRGRSAELVTATAPAGDDVLEAEAEDVAEDTAFGEQVGEFAGGVASLGRVAIEFPQTAATGAEVAGQAGAFTTTEIAEEGLEEGVSTSIGAATDAAVDVGETIAVQTIQNPAMVAGQLVGSGAIFGAARAIGPRSSLATRAAIQPGEEILGYGGAGLFRRLPGERTSRAGRRLFPDNEPLIFSEEAAIRAARGAPAAARGIAGRVRTGLRARRAEASNLLQTSSNLIPARRIGRGLSTEIENFRSDVRGQLGSQRRRRTETESAEVEEESELGPELEAFEISDRRLYDPAREFGEQRSFRSVDVTGESEFEEDIGEGIAGRGEPEAAPGRSGFGLPAELLRDVRQRMRRAEMPEVTRPRIRSEQRQRRPSFRYRTESEAEGLLEQAQQPEVEVEDTELSGEEDTGLFGAAEFESELEQEATRTELSVEELERLDTRPTFESTFAFEQPLERELDQELEAELEQELEAELELEREQEREGEREQELERELEREREQETEREQEFERELEREREQELELELEREVETERELEVELFDGGPDGESTLSAAFGAESADIITEFRNPLTGDVIETEREPEGFF